MRTGDRITRSSVGRGGVESWDSTPGWERRVERVVRVCGLATTMLGRHWNSRHPSPLNSQYGPVPLRNNAATRCRTRRSDARIGSGFSYVLDQVDLWFGAWSLWQHGWPPRVRGSCGPLRLLASSNEAVSTSVPFSA